MLMRQALMTACYSVSAALDSVAQCSAQQSLAQKEEKVALRTQQQADRPGPALCCTLHRSRNYHHHHQGKSCAWSASFHSASAWELP